jgi:hypothetical protein
MKVKSYRKNMTEVTLNDGQMVLFSYKTPVAAFIPGEGFYRTEKRWGVTTSRHINEWLLDSKAQTKPQEWFDNLT